MADTSLFPRLKRLFSTDVLIRNVGGTELKVMDINKIQMSGEVQTNSLIDRFKRVYTTSPTSLYGQNSNINFHTLRPQLYSEYDAMDADAIVASSLDILADESTLKNDFGEVLQIRSSDENIQRILYNLHYDVLNIEFNLWSWIRNMCKYGDFFLKLEIAEKYGVYNVIPYMAYHIERHEGYDPENPSAIKFVYKPDGLTSGNAGYSSIPNQDTANAIVFDNYEMAHFRLLADTNLLPYGRSYLEPARKLFKQYTLMEDAMLIHRIVRAPEKRIFYVNIGGIAPAEVDGFMQKTINALKRTPYLDPQTGEYNLRYNMQNMLEDFYVPVRNNDQATKIDTAKGLDYTGIDDVTYLRDKLFAALKVPKAFMGYEKDLSGKATLAAQDIRFARTVERLQKIMVSELYKISLIHLYTQGFTGENLTNFTLSLTTPSIIYDQERIALLKEKVALAKDIIDIGLLPTDWIYDNVFHLSDDTLDEYRDQIREDAKRKFRLLQIENEGNDPNESGVSYGTPHDLATLYGRGRYDVNTPNTPEGYGENIPLGRPEEKVSNINTQDNALGKDRLGKKAMKVDDQSNKPGQNFKTHPSLALESSAGVEFLKNKKLFEHIKKTVFTHEDNGESLLNEDQLKK